MLANTTVVSRTYDPAVCAIHMLHEHEVYLGLVSFPTDKPGWVSILPWSPAVQQCAMLVPVTSIHRIEDPAPDRYIRSALNLAA